MDRNLIVRTCSAAVFLLAFYYIYFLFDVSGLALTSLLIIFLGSNEFGRMFFKGDKVNYVFFTSLCLLTLLTVYFTDLMAVAFFNLIVITFFVLLKCRKSNHIDSQIQLIFTLFSGLIYTVLLPMMAVKLLLLEGIGLYLFMTVLAISFSNDIFAYFTGRLWGKNKILPYISPKKTIAGSYGGIIASALVALYLLYFYNNLLSPIVALLIGVLGSIAGQCGDFFASLLKRVTKVKDSGKLMPGHGGVLDRLDGVYFVAPATYCLYIFLSKLM